MFESTAAWLLNRVLGKYVQDLDTEHLNVGVFSGEVRLTDLRLKPEALYELQLPIEVKCGVVGQVSLSIPWSAGLSAQPLAITIEDVLVVAGPVLGDMFDCELERRLVRAAKRKLVEQLETSCSLILQPADGLRPGLAQQLAASLLGHVRVTLRNVHLRYEDTVSSPEAPLSCGLCLHGLSLETTNSKWKPASPAASASAVYQLARAESLSFYWNARTPPNALVLSCENWRHAMTQGLRTFSVNGEPFDFVIKPVSAKAKLIASRQAEARGVPRLLLDVVVQDAAVQLSRSQLVSMAALHEAFQRMARNREFRELHPGVNPHNHAAQWWRYAFAAVLEQRVRPYSWQRIKKHREDYREYRDAFRLTLLRPNDTELRLDLQKLEDRLGIVDIVVAREHAKMLLQQESADRVTVSEKAPGWCGWLRGNTDPELRLDVAAAKERGLWSRLSAQERERLCEAAGLTATTAPSEKPKHYIEHKFNVTLANVTATLLCHGHEIAVATLTQALASLETRPAANAFRLSARADGLVLEGASAENELMPLLSADALEGGGSVLAIDFEKNPLAHDADFALSMQLEPFEIVYNEHTLSELLGFLQPPGVSATLTRWLGKLSHAGRAAAQMAASRRKTLHLSLDLKGPYFVLPESGSLQRGGNVLVADFGRLTVRSELQPRDGLADAEALTQSELEERLYDRVHAELAGTQLLFCDSGEEWREARRRSTQQDCDLHVLGRVRATAVLSASVRPDYRQLPRHKLNVSLGSLKLNLSERRLAAMLEFADAIPMPAPKSLHCVATPPPPDLDAVPLPPRAPQLRLMRSLLVAAHLARQRSEVCTPGLDVASPAGLLARAATLDHDRGSSEQSDEEPELWARAMDQPGFEDNVSPHNVITALLRFTLAELVVHAGRGDERPYLMLRLAKLCADVALMEYGPAMQLSLGSLQLVDKSSASGEGRYLELLSAEAADRGDVLTVLFRKVRADCPDFKSHFHSVERSVVLELAALNLTLHREALLSLSAFLAALVSRFRSHDAGSLLAMTRGWLQRGSSSPPSRCSSRAAKSPRHRPTSSSCCCVVGCMCDSDPPVPPGATKFSYSARLGEARVRLCDNELDFLELKVWGLESDCVFKANERLVLRVFLAGLQAEDLSDLTLYPKIVYAEGEHVVDAKLVRHAPRLAGLGRAESNVKPEGSLRVSLGRLHVVMLSKLFAELQHFASPWLRPGAVSSAARCLASSLWARAELSPMNLPRLQVALELHLPTLLLPQKSDSPNLVVVNLGDLSVENFYKLESAGSVVDNALVHLTGVQVSRAVMTLAGSLEAQEPVLEPAALRLDVRRAAAPPPPGSSPVPQPLWAVSGAVLEPGLRVNLGQRDLATLLAVASDNPAEAAFTMASPPASPPSSADSVRQLQAFFCRSERARPESSVRLSLESCTLTLFADLDEVLSSPVRDLERGLCRLQLNELAVAVESSSDHRGELRASLQSARLDDLRSDGPVYVRRVLETCGTSSAASHVSVSSPPFLDVSLRQAPSGDRVLDVVVERSRLNLSVPFLASLGRFLLDALPGERPSDGGLVNLGYVGDCREQVCSGRTVAPLSAHDDSGTSGYFSAAEDVQEPGLSVTVQLRRPELMLLGDPAMGPALLVRAEVSLDLSTQPPSRETLTVSVSQLQVVSRSQGVSATTREVLAPCDVELRRNVAQGETRVSLNVSAFEVRLCPSLVHVAAAAAAQLTAVLQPGGADEVPSPQHFLELEEMWSPRKIPPCVPLQMECEQVAELMGNMTCSATSLQAMNETLEVNVPRVRLVLELDASPVLWLRASLWAQARDWSSQLRASAQLQLQAAVRNEALDTWEPLLEPCEDETGQKPWQLDAKVFHAPSFPVCSRVSAAECELPQRQVVQPTRSHTPVQRRRAGDDSETSADEEQPREMMFVRRPGNEHETETRSDTTAGCSSREDSDSESEEGAVARLVGAIGHLCASPAGDSSAEQSSDSEDDSGRETRLAAATEASDTALTFDEDVGPRPAATHVLLSASQRLELTLTPAAVEVLHELANAFQSGGETSCIVSGDEMTASCRLTTAANEPPLALENSLGPGSHVTLTSRQSGEEQTLAAAGYDSEPSSPGSPAEPCNAASEGSDSETSQFEGGFARHAVPGEELVSPCFQPQEESLAAKYRRVMEQKVVVRMEGLRELQVLLPTRQTTTLHTLLGGPQRYLVAVSTELRRGGRRRIEVRSPLRLRNDTAFALAILYRKSVLDALGAAHVGESTNPFEDAVRMALLAPDETLSVPLLVAHHCRLYVRPAHLDQCAASEAGLLLAELSPGDAPRDLVCSAKDQADAQQQLFCVRAMVEAGSDEDSRDVLVRLVPPMFVLNELPLALEVSAPESGLNRPCRLEAGARSALHGLVTAQSHRVQLQLPRYLGTAWSGSFSLIPDLEERQVTMTPEEEDSLPTRHLALSVRLQAASLHVFAPFWLLNKTGLPLQIRGAGSDAVYESRGTPTEEPLLFSFKRRRRRAVRVRVHQSSWSSAFPLDAPGMQPGLVVCRDRERGDRRYRVLASVVAPCLCPHLTRVLTLLPCWLVCNATRKHLRFMEDNERADLWVDLAPGQSTNFWPETETMRMFVRLRGSQLVSPAFPIGRQHRTVLRMDKGCGLTVEVVSESGPLCIWFRHAASGEAPVRVDNQCSELAVKLQQRDATASWLLGPGQALLYTWDEPCREPRELLWSISKGEAGHVAEILRDGFGHERISCTSSSQPPPQRLSSRLSAGLRKLSVRPATEPLHSSSDDEDRPSHQAHSLVHWVSYLEGRQRVLLLTRDERLARQVRAARLEPERASFELCVALAGVGLSLCGMDSRRRPREVAYLSLQASAPAWEVLGARRWRPLPAELSAWLEDRWCEEPRVQRAQLRDLVHVDLVTLRMTKPFFGELRRRHAPGFWLQYRRAESSSYVLCRVHRLQVDNQLTDATFPCVVFPSSSSRRGSIGEAALPCFELVLLRSHRAGHLVLKYVKLLLGEWCIRMERGFLQSILAAATHRERDTEQRELRARSDIAALHQPVTAEPPRPMVPLEYLYLSPVSLRLSYLPRDAHTAATAPCFASDLTAGLERILPEHVTDKRLRLGSLELRGGDVQTDLFGLASRHYSAQMAQQFATRVLGLDVLGNPLLAASPGADPAEVRGPDELSEGLALAAQSSLGHVSGGVTLSLGVADCPELRQHHMQHTVGPPPAAVAAAHSLDLGLAINIAGLFGSAPVPGGPPLPQDSFVRGAGRGVLALVRRGNTRNCLAVVNDALRRAVEAGEAPAVRMRLPRHLDHVTGARAYSVYEAAGLCLLSSLGRGHFAETDDYWAHAALDPRGVCVALLTLQHVFQLASKRSKGHHSWDVQWACRLDEIATVPHVTGDKLILQLNQGQQAADGTCRWLQSDDPAVLQWLQWHLETAMIAGMHSKPLQIAD